MGKILSKNVTVHAKAEDGSYQTFRFKAGEEVPDGLVDAISNPDVWAGVDDSPSVDAGPTSGGETEGSGFGSGPFRSRKADEVKALARFHGLEADTKEEAIAALEAEGISPEDY